MLPWNAGGTSKPGGFARNNEAYGKFESECPGYCEAHDTFYVGTLKGVGRICQQALIDTYSKVAFAKLYDRKTPITAADLLNNRVVPFVEPMGSPDFGEPHVVVQQHGYARHGPVQRPDGVGSKQLDPDQGAQPLRGHRRARRARPHGLAVGLGRQPRRGRAGTAPPRAAKPTRGW